jgi:hypothetical protein
VPSRPAERSRRGRAGALAAALVWALGLALVIGVRADAAEAVLQGLDKVTARVSTFAAPIGLPVRFGTLEILADTCVKKPPEEPPETAAFLDIYEIRPGEPRQKIFSGWMFASSPALNPLEHPVYDVWLKDCR